jgi:hypothetical protein
MGKPYWATSSIVSRMNIVSGTVTFQSRIRLLGFHLRPKARNIGFIFTTTILNKFCSFIAPTYPLRFNLQSLFGHKM